MQVDVTTEKLLRLLALERKRVKDLTQKVQEGRQKASPRRLRALISEMKSRLPEVEEARNQATEAETRLRDFESVKEALFKGQETHATLRLEIREIKEKLKQARDYGAEMQQKLAARDKSKEAAGGAAELRYLHTLSRLRTLEKHALSLRHLLDHCRDLREENARAEQVALESESRFQRAQGELGRQMKEATMLRASLEQAEQATAERDALVEKLRWAEGKLDDLQGRLTHLESQASHYRELQKQYEEMSDLVKRLRSLGDL